MKPDMLKPHPRRPSPWIFAAIMALLTFPLTGCKGKAMTMDTPTVSANTAPITDGISVGRLNLHAPMVSTVWFGKVKISDVEVSLEPLDGKNLAEWIAARQKKIRVDDGRGGSREPIIRSYQLSDNLPATLSWKFPNANYQQLEAYRQVNDRVLVGSTMGLPDERALSERLVTGVLDSFRQQPATYTATGGFGVDGGLIQKPFDNNESANATVALHLDGTPADPKEQPQLGITTEVFGNAAPATLPSRVSRLKQSELLMQAETPGLSMKTLRHGPKTVAGLAGQESFTLIHDPHASRAPYGFTAEFEYGGDANNPVRPYLQITFKGDLQKAEANGADIIRVWDGMLQSARFHP